jgi:hypothetical protein
LKRNGPLTIGGLTRDAQIKEAFGPAMGFARGTHMDGSQPQISSLPLSLSLSISLLFNLQ